MNDQEQQLNVLAQAMIQLQQLSQAAQNGDQKATVLLQEIQKRAQAMVQQSGSQMAKCGAKLKRKEDGGVVEDKCGAKMKKKSIGGAMKPCNCKKRLAKIGGKIVNVDCNGNIIK